MLVVVVLFFVALAIGLFALLTSFDQGTEQARVVRARLLAVMQAEARHPSEQLALLRDELYSSVPALNRVLASSSRISKLQKLLLQAEMQVRPGKFLLISICSAAVASLGTNIMLRGWIWAPLAFIFAGSVPFIFLWVKRTRRFHAFEAKFPEAIDLLGRGVRAGHAFTTALEIIANEIAEPVGGEFRKVYEEQKFGLPTRDALLNLVDRVPILDVKFFVTSILLQRETGGNLAEILDKLSYVIRERFKIQRQIRVFTAQGRLTLMILMALPPGVLIMMQIANPDFVRPLFTELVGHQMLAAALVLQVIGFFLIRRIISIRV